ncbi:MAG: hypothetical protein HQL36_08515, partial [Alphaproteobacteria bacterium]|nr:hypothetical protein [Alphaproteobacteria bacterium]
MSNTLKAVGKSLIQGQRTMLSGVPGGMDARILSELARDGRDVLFVARDDVSAARMDEALAFFEPEIERLDFPAWDCL